MSLARTAAAVVLALLLTTTLVATTAVGAAHLTVLDPEFVTDSIEEEGGYAMVEQMARQSTGVDPSAGGEAGVADTDRQAAASGPVDTSSLLEAAMSEEFVAAQTEANVHRAYAYLHGNRETLNLSIATAPIRENVSAGVERQLRNASVVELVGRSDASLDGPVNVTVLERMTANESSYEAVKTDLRDQVRAEVLDAAVEETFTEATNDELVRAAGENPDRYTEAQKERFVREHEPEIRDALRERIEDERSDEINATVDDQLASMRANATAGSADTETGEAVLAIQEAVARGLTTDQSYQAFRSDLDAAKADLAAASADRMDEELAAEFPDRIDLTENVTGGADEPLGEARTAVTWLDRLAFVLPAVGLGLVGLLYYVRRSVPAVASDTGLSMLAAGIPVLAGVRFGRSQLESLTADAPAEQGAMLDVLVGMAGRVMSTVGDLALALTVAGALLVVGSLAARYGLVDQVRERLGDGSGDRGTL